MALFTGKNVVVTGGAGFIGSHIVDELLLQGANVTVFDNMKSGQPPIVEEHKKHKNYAFRKLDLYLDDEKLKQELKGKDFVFHLAANADIRGGIGNTRVDLEQNTIATYNVLEAMRINGVKEIAFTSSAAIYGEPSIIPTPENIAVVQNSLYGASKLAGESLIQAFSFYYGMRNFMYRFVSIVGERYPHGVVIDFVKKLRANPKQLEILGNGKQQKSFLYVKDCVAGVMLSIERAKDETNIFNLGQNYTLEVDKVADIVINELGLKGVNIVHTSNEPRGWKGDQKIVLLDTNKIRSLGWGPKVRIEEGVRRTAASLKTIM